MPKYAEGAVSPSGKHVVRGGKWVPVGDSEDTSERDARREAIVAPAVRGAVERGTAEEQARREYMAGSKVAAGGAEALEGARPEVGEAIAAGAGLALGGPAILGAARGAGGVLRFAKPALGLAKDLAVAKGIESSGIPGAETVAGVYLGRGLPKSASSFAKFLAERLGKRAVKGVAARAGGAVAREAGRAAGAGAPVAERVAGAAPKVHGERILELLERQMAGPVAGKVTAPAAAAAGKAAPKVYGEQVLELLQKQVPHPATAPGSLENLVLRLKDMGSTAEGRKGVLEYLRTQPPETAREIRALLGRAVQHRPFIGGR